MKYSNKSKKLKKHTSTVPSDASDFDSSQTSKPKPKQLTKKLNQVLVIGSAQISRQTRMPTPIIELNESATPMGDTSKKK